jgi:hypothetical protein
MHDMSIPFKPSSYHSETEMVDHIIKRTPLIDWQKIENNKNVPDLFYAGYQSNGWMEAKYTHGYSKDGSVIIHRFTQGQRRWLRDMQKRGVKTWVLLAVNGDIFLISPHRFAEFDKKVRIKFYISSDDIKITSPMDIYDALGLAPF